MTCFSSQLLSHATQTMLPAMQGICIHLSSWWVSTGACAAAQGKVCAAVCHGPAALTEAKLDGVYLVKGKKVRPVELPSCSYEMSWAPPGLKHLFFPGNSSVTLVRTWPVVALDYADEDGDDREVTRHCLRR